METVGRSSGTLREVLEAWAGGDALRLACASTVADLARAARDLGDLVASAPLVGGLGDAVGTNASGDTKKALDDLANDIVANALDRSLVAAFGSEESDEVEAWSADAPLVVAVDPLDGSANLAINGPLGMIFSLRPRGEGDPTRALLRPGVEQLVAGFVFFGPATMMALSLGEGTDLYTMDADGEFRRTTASVRIPSGGSIYSINASNARHWSTAVRAYVADLEAGVDGPLGEDVNMRWYGALVMEALRMLVQGGIYLYPGDARPRYRSGLLRLVYEAHPVAMLIEQAGGVATDGEVRILEKAADDIHDRTPLVFGSSDRVAEAQAYFEGVGAGHRAPLFADRGLFRR